ncbi:MAG: carbamate kinase [Candidatus Thermoplasmatota archaeon]|jgi:carbamate kinase|nr:carbamate kinase [Candidatus Thermoplasmatota archaeon]MCL5984117.1 carbamate kinase [Candidatus Thermoplasmatota archaeon]
MSRVLVALGGNAISKAGEKGTWEEAVANMESVVRPIARLVEDGEELILTHGNGPQVGSLMIQQEAAKSEAAPLPMSALGAMTEGWIGFLISQVLTNAIEDSGGGHIVMPIVTRVVVSATDPSFRHPSKPVGPYYSENEARLLKKQRGWVMEHDPRRGGWRRIVPSPKPIDVIEGPAIRRLLDAGLGTWAIIVAGGGGGIPVVRRRGGKLEAIDAVIDKDRTAALLATMAGVETLAIVTDVPHACVGFNTARERPLGKVTSDELARHLQAGEFGNGSMRPKVEAALSFLAQGGRRAIITDAFRLGRALQGKAGTLVER